MNTEFAALEPLESRISPATLHVTNLLDDLSGGTLREAILAANADPVAADTIVFDAGVVGTIDLDPGKNAIPIAGAVTIKGPGIDKLVVNGGTTTRAFFIDDGGPGLSPVSISNLGIAGGAGGTNGGAIVCFEPLSLTNVGIIGGQVNSDGGGLWVGTAGKVSLSGCRILGNSADLGGGVNIEAEAGISITKTIFSGNEALSGGGARLVSVGPSGFIKISSSQVVNNVANVFGGGLALAVDPARHVALAKCVIEGNSSKTGGGDSASSAGALAVTGTLFQGNVGGATGGALFFNDDSTGNIKGAKFLENLSQNTGGAISSAGTGTIDLSGSFFRGNVADGGGAVRIIKGDARIVSCSFFDNAASMSGGDGGAISIGAGAGVVTLAKLKVTGNSASIGGGIANAGASSTLSDSTVIGNFAITGPNTSSI